MKIKMHGQMAGKVLLLIGTWCPLLPEDKKLATKAVQKAKELNLNVCMVMFNPKPAETLFGRATTRYESCDMTIEVLRDLGVHCILEIAMSKTELSHKDAMYFLSKIHSIIPVYELWIAYKQSLGYATTGNHTAIRKVCDLLGISLVIFPYNRRREHQLIKYTDLMEAGRATELINLTGRLSVYNKAKVGTKGIFVGWRPGLYKAMITYSNKIVLSEITVSYLDDEKNFLELPSHKYLKSVAIIGDRIEP